MNARGGKKSRCRACGACCRKGGPALHCGDIPLLRQGVLPPESLLTLRAGEPVRDDARGTLAPLPREIIKAASGGGWTCPFLDAASGKCSIYARRPAECRALFCEDASALLAMYERDRLTRAEALPLLHPDWPALAAAHEAECSWARLAAPAARAHCDAEAEQSLLEALRFDQAFRDLAAERAAVPAAAMPLIFGRPIRTLLAAFGLAPAERGTRLVRSGLSVYPVR